MFDILRRWLRPPRFQVVPIRFHHYRDHLDLTGKPLILLCGNSIESARALIPFLMPSDEMHKSSCDLKEIIAMNGEQADEIHAFANVIQGGAKVTRLFVREGKIIEVTLQG